MKHRPVTIRFRKAKVNRLRSTGELHWTKMDQSEVRESVPLEECSCYSDGGDLSQVPTLYAVLSTVSAQLNTQNECSDKKQKFNNFVTQNRAKAKRKCFFQWQAHSENERKLRFAESEDFCISTVL